MHYWPLMLLVISGVLQLSSCHNKSYSGYKMFRLMPRTEQIPKVRKLQGLEGIDFWSHTRSAYVDIMVAPNQTDKFQDFLRSGGIDSKLQIEDVQKILDKEKRVQRKMGRRYYSGVSFDHFNRLNEINKYLDDLASKYPNIATVSKIGTSYEGRDLKIVRISSTKSPSDPAILIDAGIHAREWVAPAMALYIINQLVENITNSNMIASLDWHILPVVNPDGYEFSHSVDRMWRKTRSKLDKCCYGVDGNRNFDFHWNEVGTEPELCSEIFAGYHPFSESETQALRDYGLKLKGRLKLYITFHSYGNAILHTWGYTKQPPDNAEDMYRLGKEANEANVKAGGEQYDVGSSGGLFYEAAGGSDDWMMAVAGAQFSYTVELTDTITGFVLPPKLIKPTVKTFFEAVRIFANHVKNMK